MEKKKSKISKIAKFQSDLLKTNENIAPQSRDILQTFVWCGALANLPPSPHTTFVKFSQLYGAISSLV